MAKIMRNPAVAGSFYPSSAPKIKEEIGRFLSDGLKPQEALGCMLPHAGYIYSGAVAAKTLARVIVKSSVILIGPNHTGLGAEFSLMDEGSWITPLGEVRIDSGLAHAILKNSQLLVSDSLAHLKEHSLEVELPLLQYFKPDFEIVPITVFSTSLKDLKRIGQEIAGAVIRLNRQSSVLLVASSDMTHYESKQDAEDKDKQAIEAILKLDEDTLLNRVRNRQISMCGAAPCAIMLAAAKHLGATKAELVDYRTSGDVTGDYNEVVSYAGIIIS